MEPTPEEQQKIIGIHRAFDEHLKQHLVKDLKTFASFHAPWVALALVGAALVVALGIALLMRA